MHFSHVLMGRSVAVFASFHGSLQPDRDHSYPSLSYCLPEQRFFQRLTASDGRVHGHYLPGHACSLSLQPWRMKRQP
uniref:Uncharacterized protein n=1 Tax=Klebsiella pneumoniae TaxID=573 RepID=A0A8B0SST5_KLEPN|nr:hypothetical protein [Klebsiella pneumoniae]